MKLSSIAYASIITLAAFAANGAVAKNISDGAAKGQATEGTAQPTTCPAGQSWNASTKKCVAASDFSKGMQVHGGPGIVDATPLNNRQNVSGSMQQTPSTTTTPPK